MHQLAVRSRYERVSGTESSETCVTGFLWVRWMCWVARLIANVLDVT